MLLYKFKVALDHNKRIYREIEILGTQSLDELHEMIFEAFDRYEEHLYAFYITRKAAKSLQTRYHSPQYPPDDFSEDLFSFLSFGREDNETEDIKAEGTIDSLELKIKEKIYYLFDFGDSWWHEITLLSVKETDKTAGFPRIVKKEGKSPDQYSDILE